MTECYDCSTNQCDCATRTFNDGVLAERARIVAWLRTYPQTCSCGMKDCTFTSVMTVDELADALERGAHE